MTKKNIDESFEHASSKARYWIAVGYPENMKPNWQETIDEDYQLPYAYCVHDKDKLEATAESEEDRKVHVHFILAFPNTTTGRHALNVFRKLNVPGKNAFPACFPIINIRNKYDYLIHRTQKAQKDGKYQYGVEERICGNNFDIGAYVQISTADKTRMRKELSKLVAEKAFCTYLDFYFYVVDNMDDEYENVVTSYSGHFRELTRSMFLKRTQSNMN
jgi:hypothetical protein